VLARYLTPALLGVYLLVIAYPEALQQLLDFRVNDTMTRYLGRFVAQGRKAEAVALIKALWLLDIAVAALVLLIVLVSAGIAAGLLLDGGEHAGLTRIYAVALFVGSLDTASGAVLRVLDRFRLAFLTASAAMFARLALVLLVVMFDAGLEGAVRARAASIVIWTAVLGGATLVVLRTVFFDERHAPIATLRGTFREIGAFLVNMNLTATLKMATSKLDVLLVGALATPAAVGIYRIAVQFATAPQLLTDGLFAAVYPALAKAHAVGGTVTMRRIGAMLTAGLAATVVPAAVLVLWQREPLLTTIVGADFAAAADPFAVVLLAVVPFVLLFWLRPVILSYGHSGALLRIVAAGSVVHFGGLILLVPPFGATGAALSTAATYVLVVALHVLFVVRRGLLTRSSREPLGT
jgi:O-antigen/teichoic acid export membrane protein